MNIYRIVAEDEGRDIKVSFMRDTWIGNTLTGVEQLDPGASWWTYEAEGGARRQFQVPRNAFFRALNDIISEAKPIAETRGLM